jgi:hypothetical protein
MALWGQDKPAQKRQGVTGEGWLRSPYGCKVVRIVSAGETLHAKWVTVTDADVVNGSIQIRHSRRMLRYNAKQLWKNLIWQGWQQVAPQW